MKLFAYGSNLCLHRLRRRVPGAAFVGRARLDGYQLRFHKRGFRDGSGKANVLHTGNAAEHVWGAVFTCPDEEKCLLDHAEGLGSGYDEEVLQVCREDGTLERVRAYVADPATIDDALLPFTWYLRYVREGAAERGLPAAYRLRLEEQACRPDPDRTRARGNLLVPAGLA